MLKKMQAERIKVLARDFAYSLCQNPEYAYGRADIPLIDYLDSLTDETQQPGTIIDQQTKPIWETVAEIGASAPDEAWGEVVRAGTITAEEHRRLVREAVKAAYERAAERCKALMLKRFLLSAPKKYIAGYDNGCEDCAAAIRAMGDSDE